MGKVLVSFRIDDVTFAIDEMEVIKNALILAQKYNVTFDLAVVAQKFEKNRNSNVYKIFLENKNRFEIVAHGWDHKNPIHADSKGEFYDIKNKLKIPPSIQREHLDKMLDVFRKHKIRTGQKILALPWHSGDDYTFKYAEKIGYKLITQIPFTSSKIEDSYQNIVISKAMIQNIPLRKKLTSNEINAAISEYQKLLNEKQKFIQIYLHLPNFLNGNNTDLLVMKIKSVSNNDVNFDFISKRF